MKTTMIFAAAIAVILSSGVYASVMSSPEPDTSFKALINKYPKNVVELRMQKAPGDEVKLTVYDEKGLKLYNRRVKKHNVVELDMDLSNLENGTYTFVVEKNGEVVLEKEIEKTGK